MNKMEEIWKIAIEDEPYEISNLGNLRNGYKILKGCVDVNSGYKRFNIKRNDKIINYKFHFLVARKFIGERPEGLVIDHINRNRLDNRVENLRYVSFKENRINSISYKEGVERLENGRISRWKGIRRRKGEGQLYNYPNGSWRATKKMNKKKYEKTFKTKEEAEEYLKSFSD